MIVIGAGPAGLAVAALLRQRGVRPTVLEQSDRVGGAWPDRWDSLRLHTMRSLSGLPDRPIPRPYGRWVGRDDFVRYLRDYANHFGVSPELGVGVERIDRSADGWTRAHHGRRPDVSDGRRRHRLQPGARHPGLAGPRRSTGGR